MEDAFIFDNPDILCIGGYLPIVVLKEDGSFIPMTQYVFFLIYLIFIIDHLTQYPYEYMFEVQLCAQ